MLVSQLEDNKRHQGIILISKTPSPPAYITNYNIHVGLASDSERQLKGNLKSVNTVYSHIAGKIYSKSIRGRIRQFNKKSKDYYKCDLNTACPTYQRQLPTPLTDKFICFYKKVFIGKILSLTHIITKYPSNPLMIAHCV